jgi:uncharacterized protein YndB with AHSA1/START domain
VDEALRSVADPTRRAILRMLRDGEVAAGAIALAFPGISRPAVSQHLRILHDAGLVRMRPDGNRRLYRLRPEGFAEAAAFLDDLWSARLDQLTVVAEQEGKSMEKTVLIAAPRAVVWRCFTDPDLRARWLGAGVLDARAGGRLEAHLAGGPVVSGDVLEAVDGERLVFTFGWEPVPGLPDLPPGASRVEVTLADEAGGTRVTVRHSELPDELVERSLTGWDTHLGRLRTVAGTG